MPALEELLHQVLGNAEPSQEGSSIAGMARALFQGLPGGMNSHGVGDLAGLTEKFEAAGYGEVARSWQTGAPRPVTEAQLREALGDDAVRSLAAGADMTEDDMLTQLAQLLPGMVARIHGAMPAR